MKKLITLLTLILGFGTVNSNGQVIFWTENFESGSSSGLTVPGYVSPNGFWGEFRNVSGPNGSDANRWYVSCAEAGHTYGVCGTGCGSPVNATLHVGSTTLGDIGASYDAGGLCSIGGPCVATDDRIESPTINCTGKSNILLKFYYIENGDATTDNGTVWYSANNGVVWTLLKDPVKTPLCGAQGQWSFDTVRLPVSANNNATVKIAFRWTNNEDGLGTDPSYAVDSVSLSVAPTPPVASYSMTPTTVCQDSCVTVTSTSTGFIDSVRWKVITGTGIIAAPTASVSTVCLSATGSSTIRLYVYGPGGMDSTTQTVTVKQSPKPTITLAASPPKTLQVPNVYASYQWYNGVTAITGATTYKYTYTYPPAGVYSVIVDSSNGCKHLSKNIYPVNISSISGEDDGFWLSQQDGKSITLHSKQALREQIMVIVYDITGRKIQNELWERGTEAREINTELLQKGLYIIRLNGQSSSATFKWTKQ